MTARPDTAARTHRQTAAARRERARARPAEILDAARDLFSRKGFEAARMDEVAAAAGVTKPAVYRYFPGKDRLIEALLEEDLAVPWRRLAAWIEAHEGPIEAMVEGFADRVTQMQSRGLTRGYLILALDESGRRPEIAAFIREQILAPGLMVLARAFYQAAERGELARGHDPAFMARMFFAPFLQASLGSVGYALPVGDEAEQARYRQFHTQAFLRAFRP
ncbi:MAG: helix-turn-helix transcriptional regulator [Caulobacterales bacterium]|nr:helix-turn-helix transcriptional regulator [Caulobacterales bacterium]